MFKNLTAYRIAPGWTATLAQVEAALQQQPFTPCAPTQETSAGWVPVRGQAHGALVQSVAGQWLLRHVSESRLLPVSVLQRHADEKAGTIEREQGRKPGRKERQMLRDEARLELLPQAFTRQHGMWVWIDPVRRLLLLDTATQARADEVSSALVQALPGLGLALLDTATSAPAAMAHWLLTQDTPPGFAIERECELKAADESRAVVRYARHRLDIEEVRQHIEQGKMPTRLAFTWHDRVGFTLLQTLQLKKIALLDRVADTLDAAGGADNENDRFDTEVTLVTGELSQLLDDLIEALGGEKPAQNHPEDGDAQNHRPEYPARQQPASDIPPWE